MERQPCMRGSRRISQSKRYQYNAGNHRPVIAPDPNSAFRRHMFREAVSHDSAPFK
jgi:hypothetical protein